jgi:hypothetical protein
MDIRVVIWENGCGPLSKVYRCSDYDSKFNCSDLNYISDCGCVSYSLIL